MLHQRPRSTVTPSRRVALAPRITGLDGLPSIAPIILAGEQAARDYFGALFATRDPATETLFVAHLDSASRCLHLARHGGDREGAELPVRTILTDALLRGSKGIILAHNHPSGDPRPSAADRQSTRRLALASEAIGVTLLDHLVFGAGEWTSFRRIGLL
ncbi:JAB domain-containing protein [Sphingomonas sp.]|uniref:JAB domain-containing protein n=1 Tax=Sphingomonas sp. TaxID=28214 RepID=UPI00286BD4A3|nr:JAB domain-containing protein [Sphingomonas sp.]